MILQNINPKLKKLVIVTALVAGFLMVIVNSAVWVNRYVFNTNNFTQVATESLTSESSRDAIAQEITDQALQNYPAVKGVVNNYAVNFISGLLDTQPAHTLLEKAITKLQIILTSPDQQEIVINLTEVKGVIQSLIEVSGKSQEVKFDPAEIPDQIVLFDPDSVPNFYQYSVLFSWVAVLAGLVALGLVAYPYVKYPRHYNGILLTQGVIVTFIGLLALLLGPLFKPPVLANITTANGRVVVGNLYDAFMSTFNQQSMLLVYAGLGAIAVSGVVYGVHYLRERNQANAKPAAKKK